MKPRQTSGRRGAPADLCSGDLSVGLSAGCCPARDLFSENNPVQFLRQSYTKCLCYIAEILALYIDT